MPSKNNKLFSFLFYAMLFIPSILLLVRFIDIGIPAGIIIIPAINIIIIIFRKTYKKHSGDTDKLKILFRQTLSIVFMAIPVLISFEPFRVVIEKTFLWVFHRTKEVPFSISPSLVSTLAAIMLYLSIIIRYNRKMFSDVYETIIICLNILFCASFMEIFFPKGIWNIPFINISSQSFLLIAIILSWVSMRAIAGFIWIFLFILAVTRIAGLNVAMGNLGVVYILSAFVSMGLQMGDSIKIISSFRNDFIGTAKHIGGDINSSKSFVKKNNTVKKHIAKNLRITGLLCAIFANFSKKPRKC
jgi:hypothetical protein